jgi:hypothetical protein
MVGRYTGREFNNHVNSVMGMCGLFWMRPSFLDASSISGPVLHFWTCPSIFEDGTRLSFSRGSNSPSSSNGPRASKAFFWVHVTMPGRFQMDISAEKERACLPAGVGVQGGSDFN